MLKTAETHIGKTNGLQGCLWTCGSGQKNFCCFWSTECNNWALPEFWTFFQNLSLGNYLWKLPKSPDDCFKKVPFIYQLFLGRKQFYFLFLKKNSTKEISWPGQIGHLKALWIFNPLSWKQGVKKRLFWRVIMKILLLNCKLCFSCNQKTIW